jgi:hypothetical protein
MSVYLVDERSAARITVDFLDFDDLPSAPTACSYSVIDVDSGTTLVAFGADPLTPAAQVTITLDKIGTQIVDDTKTREKHAVIVKADYGSGDEVNGRFYFYVNNLEVISGTT